MATKLFHKGTKIKIEIFHLFLFNKGYDNFNRFSDNESFLKGYDIQIERFHLSYLIKV